MRQQTYQVVDAVQGDRQELCGVLLHHDTLDAALAVLDASLELARSRDVERLHRRVRADLVRHVPLGAPVPDHAAEEEEGQ